MDEILEIKNAMQNDRPVDWDALPDIDLYMDQVVSYLSRQSTGGKAPLITSAMINNYVKDGLLPRANGKRYNREHLVYLTMIGVLKNVLTVKDMQLLTSCSGTTSIQDSYAEFLQYVDESYNGVNSALDASMTSDDLVRTAMILALASAASKTACEHILGIIRSQNEAMEAVQKDSKTKKEKEPKKAKSKDPASDPVANGAENA